MLERSQERDLFDTIAETRVPRIIFAARALRTVFGNRRSAFLMRGLRVRIFHTRRQSRWAIAPIACACPRRTTKRRY